MSSFKCEIFKKIEEYLRDCILYGNTYARVKSLFVKKGFFLYRMFMLLKFYTLFYLFSRLVLAENSLSG